MTWIAVALGGALGCIARHGVNQLVHGRWPLMTFPLATLAVNVLGCLVIGLLAGLVVAHRIAMNVYWREFMFVGILGGFTTFSTFGLDTITLLRTAPTAAAVWNVVAHIALGLLAVYGGLVVGSWR
jgi:fluoride exporter